VLRVLSSSPMDPPEAILSKSAITFYYDQASKRVYRQFSFSRILDNFTGNLSILYSGMTRNL